MYGENGFNVLLFLYSKPLRQFCNVNSIDSDSRARCFDARLAVYRRDKLEFIAALSCRRDISHWRYELFQAAPLVITQISGAERYTLSNNPSTVTHAAIR